MSSKSAFNKTLVIAAALLLILAGCGAKKDLNNDETIPAVGDLPEKLKVVTTIYPIYDFTRNVAGEHAEVIPLIPPGAEPHGWEPTPQDLKVIQAADVFVYNGGMVEYWVDQVLDSINHPQLIKVEAIAGLELMPYSHDHFHDHSHGHDHGHNHDQEKSVEGDAHDHAHDHDHDHDHEHAHDAHAEEHGHDKEAHGEAHVHDHSEDNDTHNEEHAQDAHHEENGHDHDHGHGEGELDPHVWTDPVLAQKQVMNIMEGLAQADPDHKHEYQKNAEEYIAKLQDLDKAFREMAANAKRKEFVVQHAAFGYLAERYGLIQLPIAGLSPEQEPSPSQMADIVKFVKENEVGTLFFETLADAKIAAVLAQETGAKTAVLNPIEGLTADEAGQNLDYIAIMKENLSALQDALNE